MTRCIIIPSVLVFLACAKEGFPPGGPEDKAPPRVIRTVPERGATQVDQKTDVQIWFSENVKSGAARDAVFITPNPGGKVRIKWSSKRLKIHFPDTLQSDRTYVITVGTSIRDYRNNAMEESFVLAFSTGDSLDQGKITGRVFVDENASGIGIWAYPIKRPYDPDPRVQEPDYIVQCNEKGGFTFYHMAVQTYRLFAVQDRLADRLYRPVEDGIGLTYQDIDLMKIPGHHGGPVFFRMTREDTLAPRLVRATALHSNLVSIQFNEPVVSADSVRFKIRSDTSEAGRPLNIQEFFQDSELKQWIHLITESQPDKKQFWIHVEGIRDETGHAIDTAYSSVEFVSTGQPDTIAPDLVSTSPGNRARNISVNPEIEITFSEAMDSTSWTDYITLTDTAGVRIPIDLKSGAHAKWILTPRHIMKSVTIYRLNVDSVMADLSGNTIKDTSIQFVTLNVDTLSEISGMIMDPDSAEKGDIYFYLQETETSLKSYQISIKQPGFYQFEDIFPGLYTLWAFRDRDNNGRYSHGQSYPYEPAERFFVFPDTIKARSRWTNTGNDFSLPKN
ncbi:Ig-like domain-containing protein [bacterium]|nr:Ig-like domain-containing protein [bacterium]